MIGRCLQGEEFRHFKARGGWKELQESVRAAPPHHCWLLLGLPHCSPPPPSPQVNTFGAKHPLTSLVPSLQEVDPDEAFSSVPYEKGFALLFHLEELLGGPGETHLRVGAGGGGTS